MKELENKSIIMKPKMILQNRLLWLEEYREANKKKICSELNKELLDSWKEAETDIEIRLSEVRLLIDLFSNSENELSVSDVGDKHSALHDVQNWNAERNSAKEPQTSGELPFRSRTDVKELCKCKKPQPDYAWIVCEKCGNMLS